MEILTEGERVELDGMELGVALCATGVEGGDRGNGWFYRASKGLIKDGSTPYVACEFMKRYDEDIQRIKTLGCKTARVGLEWSRIEPRRGFFDDGALKIYGDILDKFRAAGIETLVDLHHFSHPVWLEKRGGFSQKEAIGDYLEYVKTAVTQLAGRCEGFVTFDSPNRMIYELYVSGRWAEDGCRKSRRSRAYKAMSNVAAAHIAAYSLIHSIAETKGVSVKVGTFMSYRRTRNKFGSGLLAAAQVKCREKLYGSKMTEAMLEGFFLPPLKNPCKQAAKSAVKGESGVFADFFGICYRGRVVIDGKSETSKEGAAVDDRGWDLHNKGITAAIKSAEAYGLPVYFTGGIADSGDAFRKRFIAEQLKLSSEAGCARYYYDSYCDSFVFLEGVRYRYGLYEVNFATQQRKPRPSSQFYSQAVQEKGFTVSGEIIAQSYPLSGERAR